MRVATLLDPEIFDVDLLAVSVRPEEIGVAFEGRYDVLVADKGNDPFLLGPHTRPVRVDVLATAIVKELDPRRRCFCFESLDIVMDLEQITARGAAVDDLEQTECAGATVDALKPRVIVHRQNSLDVDAEKSN